MDESTLSDIGRKIVGCQGFGDNTTVVWHAGEPCVLSPDWYVAACDRLEAEGKRAIVRQSFQTNATMISDGWIDYFRRPGVGVGVSLDGPQDIHDAVRTTRSGAGTYQRTMQGIDRLNRAGIPFHLIAVVSEASMKRPREVARALIETGARWIGLNIEEIEGTNTQSTLFASGGVDRYRRFIGTFLDEVARAPTQPVIRELERFRTSVAHANDHQQVLNQENVPGAIVSVGVKGDISTFSPELLGTKSNRYGDFVFGNVADISDLSEVFLSRPFLRTQRDIHSGVTACKRSCAYFSVCGGGSPSNKLGELGTFKATETNHCTYAIKALFEVLLDRIEAA